MDESTFWRRSGTENTHLDTGTPNSRRTSKGFSLRIRWVSSTTSRLISGCRWSDKWFFGPCQETSYTAITLNPESNFIRREKNHSPFHWNTLTSPELQEQIWMLCKNAASMTIGISMGQEICLLLGHVSLSLLLDEQPPNGYVWSGGRLTRRQLTSSPDYLGPEPWTKMGRHVKLKEKQKWSDEKPKLDNARRLRGIYFIDPEDKEFKETIKNARKKLETPMAPAMSCKTSKRSKHGRPLARLMISNQNFRVSWKPVNPQDCVWKNLY